MARKNALGFRNPRLCTALGIVDPLLGKVEPNIHRRCETILGQHAENSHLAVVERLPPTWLPVWRNRSRRSKARPADHHQKARRPHGQHDRSRFGRPTWNGSKIAASYETCSREPLLPYGPCSCGNRPASDHKCIGGLFRSHRDGRNGNDR